LRGKEQTQIESETKKKGGISQTKTTVKVFLKIEGSRECMEIEGEDE